MNLLQEMRRRRVFRVIGLYIVGAWLVFQVAATFFPAWNIPDTALRYLVYAAVLGFPVAIVFGWFYDITAHGVVRTTSGSGSSDLSLQATDYLILGALAIVAVLVISGGVFKVQESADGIDVASSKPANSIAVLPFENLDADQETAYFSDGVSEEILHRLSTFKTLKVLGRASSFAFGGSDYSIPRISDILRVRYILQGTVRREADQVRVTASLLDEGGFQVWSKSFDRELDGIFSIQSDIANEVAVQLNRELTPQTVRVGATTPVTEAYTQYLIGREHSNKRAAGWQLQAAAAYRRAIELDPKFAAPYAGLAITTGLNKAGRPEDDFAELQQAQSYVDTALSIDPLLADAHAAQGLLLTLSRDLNYAASEAALRRALDIDPNYMNAYNWIAIALDMQGKLQERQDFKERALEIDPLNPIINANMATHYHNIGDFHRARDLNMRLLDLPQTPGTVLFSLVALHNEFGRLDEANRWAKELVREYLPIGNKWSLSSLGSTYRYVGMDEEADYWLEKSNEDEPNGVTAFIRRSYVQKLRGEFDKSKALLEEFEAVSNMDTSKLPGFYAQVIGAVKVMSGDVEGGIRIIESVVDLDKPLLVAAGGGHNAMDFLHMAAHAYRQTGNETRADELLRRAARYVEDIEARGIGKSPKFLELKAMNLSMRGQTEEAITVFEDAVATGWRNYHFVLHDPRWQDLLSEPAAQSLMAFVKADIDRQRQRVEKMTAAEDFRAEVEEILAASSR